MKLFMTFTTNRKMETKRQNETAGERRRLAQDLIEQGSQRKSCDHEETANCFPNHTEQCVANDRAGTAAGHARALTNKKAQESTQDPQTRAPSRNARFNQTSSAMNHLTLQSPTSEDDGYRSRCQPKNQR
jgi:hypothetical protein